MQLPDHQHALLRRIDRAGHTGHALDQGEVSGASMLAVFGLITLKASVARITAPGVMELRRAA